MSSKTYVITGASRGIGLEWISELSKREPESLVIGIVRNPEQATGLKLFLKLSNVKIVKGDITSQQSVTDAVTEIDRISSGKIDVLINNAAVNIHPGKLIEECFDQFEPLYSANVVGPIRMTLALLPLLRAGKGKTIINTTSFLGSNEFTMSQPDVQYTPYSCAKAALNLFGTKLSRQLQPESFIVISLNPGYVDTELSEHKGFISTFQSVDGMKKVIDGLTVEDSGKFYNYDGTLSGF